MAMTFLNIFGYFTLAFLIFLAGCKQNSVSNRPVKRRQSQAYALKVVSPPEFKPGKKIPFKLKVVDIKTGKPVHNFIKDQGEFAHLTVVNQQFNHFQHVHPKLNPSGVLEAPITIQEDGGNIAYLRFSTIPKQREVLKTYFYTEAKNIFSFGFPRFNPSEVVIGAYKFQLEPVSYKLHQPTIFTINVFKDDKPASVESYKGLTGHGVLINQSEWTLIPLDSLPSMSYYQQGKRYFKAPLTFMATLEEPGDYSLWLQFKINGKMEAARFTFPVCREMPCAVDF